MQLHPDLNKSELQAGNEGWIFGFRKSGYLPEDQSDPGLVFHIF